MLLVDSMAPRYQPVAIMPWYAIAGIVLGGLLLVGLPTFIWVLPWLRRTPRETLFYGALFRFGQGLFWSLHRYRSSGQERRPQSRHPGRLLVVCNHTGSVDPFLVQFVCPFHIRWITASATVPRLVRPLANYLGTLNIARSGCDTGGLRKAIRYLNTDHVLGIFPEGKIAVPPREIGPFASGVGYLVAKTHTPVLLVWISGTPDTDQVFTSLLRPSRSRVTFVDYLEFEPGTPKAEITNQLRQRLQKASGWPLREDVHEPGRMST